MRVVTRVVRVVQLVMSLQTSIIPLGFLVFPWRNSRNYNVEKASTSGASSSRQPPSPQDEEEEEDIIYSCAPKVASILDTVKLKTLVDRYQIPKEFNSRLPIEG